MITGDTIDNYHNSSLEPCAPRHYKGSRKDGEGNRQTKARSKLRHHFIQQTGLDSWQEAKEKFPEATVEVDKVVGEFNVYPETIITISHLSHLLQKVGYWNLSFRRVKLWHPKIIDDF